MLVKPGPPQLPALVTPLQVIADEACHIIRLYNFSEEAKLMRPLTFEHFIYTY